MNPIIFRISPTNTQLKIIPSEIKYSDKLNSQLIKYGFNQSENNMDIAGLMENKYYRNGLNLDTFIMPLINAQITEITKLFDLVKPKINVYIDDVKLVKSLFDNADNKSKKDYQLVIKIYSTSNPSEINEQSYLQILANDLKSLLDMQKEGSSMIIQMGDIKTLPMAQIVYYLSTLYTESYLIKPVTSNELSSERYLVLLNLKTKTVFPTIKTDSYINSFINEPIPNNVNTAIQCFNSRVMALKLFSYERIKKYLDEKVYEGSLYQDMMKKREIRTTDWKDKYMSSKNLSSYLDELINDADAQCRVIDPEY